MSIFIQDGYTLDAKIEGKGPRPDLNFRYRPALPEVVSDYALQLNRNPGKASVGVTANYLAGQLVSWDAKDEKGEVTPVTAELLKRIPLPVLDEMVNYVSGYSIGEQRKDQKN